MKTISSEAGAMFMNKGTPGPELCHFYDGSAALQKNIAISLEPNN